MKRRYCLCTGTKTNLHKHHL
uniref:Uncharacterized protein n=1 Tax=Anguilla anguilla TaxID=7936 RepID=A0A0E9SIT8_ANGAN